MNTPKFYIYGVPDGFNMLSGTPEEILYFQLFYDTGKKGRELRINRKPNGETVYSYLIYNLVACSGREGAFLGMSIAFYDNEYCDDSIAIKELFEGIYNEVILKAKDNEKIIAAIDGGNAVGRFCISRFKDRQEMCEKIGRIIINNVNSALVGSIRTINHSFDNSKEGRILTLPLDADNSSIARALQSYMWVSLSSECKATPQPHDSKRPPVQNSTSVGVDQDLLSVHFIDELSRKVGSYKDFIIRGLKNDVSDSEISTKQKEISHHLDTIEGYVGRQPELKMLKEDYMSVYNELVDLKKRRMGLQEPPQPPQPPQSPHDDWIVTFIRTYLSRIIAVLCTIFVIAIVVHLWPTDSPTPPPDDQEEVENLVESGTDKDLTTFNEKEFKGLLEGADYKAAWSMLQKVEDEKKRENLKQELQDSYRNWFNNEFSNRRDLQGLRELKEKISDYADFNVDNDKHNNLLDNYINFLEESGASQKKDRQEPVGNKDLKKPAGEGTVLPDTPGTPGGMPNGNVIKIFKADVNYNPQNQISASGNVITCKRNSYFVVEGANTFWNDNKNKIEVARSKGDGKIHIRVPNCGQFIVKLNQVEYTFNVEPL